jgi:hypothetical protein
LAQSRLVGDVDQALLALAVDPNAKWEEYRERGNLAEFLTAVREKLGDLPETDNPVLWVKGVVERLALTEAFVAYGERDDFPFANRIPPGALPGEPRPPRPPVAARRQLARSLGPLGGRCRTARESLRLGEGQERAPATAFPIS